MLRYEGTVRFEIELKYGTIQGAKVRSTQILNVPYCTAILDSEYNVWYKRHGSGADIVIASFLQRSLSNELGSNSTLVTLLRPWIRRFTMIISAVGFKQAANSVDKNSKKSTETLDRWKLLRRCEFQTSHLVCICNLQLTHNPFPFLAISFCNRHFL